MQGRLNAMRAHVEYARAEVWLRRKRVLGPLGLVCKGLWWGVGKLFVIRG